MFVMKNKQLRIYYLNVNIYLDYRQECQFKEMEN